MHRCGTYDEWQEFQLSRDPSPSRIQVKNKRMKSHTAEMPNTLVNRH